MAVVNTVMTVRFQKVREISYLSEELVRSQNGFFLSCLVMNCINDI
jgi:hypothetical protein